MLSVKLLPIRPRILSEERKEFVYTVRPNVNLDVPYTFKVNLILTSGMNKYRSHEPRRARSNVKLYKT